MTTVPTGEHAPAAPQGASDITGAHLRTFETIFHHPIAQNLDWHDVVGLGGVIGTVHEKPNGSFLFDIAGRHLTLHRPRGKDITTDQIVAIRHFLTEAGYAPEPTKA